MLRTVASDVVSVELDARGKDGYLMARSTVTLYITCIYIYMCDLIIYIYICMHVYIYIYISMYIYIYICICMYVCMHVCMYVCMYVCIGFRAWSFNVMTRVRYLLAYCNEPYSEPKIFDAGSVAPRRLQPPAPSRKRKRSQGPAGSAVTGLGFRV